MRIIILEDNEDRQRVMQDSLAGCFPGYDLELFATVHPMIERLSQTGLYDVALVSLDHDLELQETDSTGRLVDPGTGVDLAAWLASQPAVAPVIVHTTNGSGGDRMVELLANGGWQHSRVVPYGGESWITESWLPLVRNLIVSQLPGVSLSFLGTQIMKCSVQANRHSREYAILEFERAAASLLADLPDSQSLRIELLYLGKNNRWKTIGSPSVFGQLPHGALTTEMLNIVSIGPVPITESQLSDDMVSTLEHLGVRVVQLEIAQPTPNMQAILCITSHSLTFPFKSHRVQSILRELKSLIELALLVDWQHTKKSPRRETADIDPFPAED